MSPETAARIEELKAEIARLEAEDTIQPGTLCKFWDGDSEKWRIVKYGGYDLKATPYNHIAHDGSHWLHAEPVDWSEFGLMPIPEPEPTKHHFAKTRREDVLMEKAVEEESTNIC